jgi:hypothetical protein
MQITTALNWATPTRHPHRVQRKSRLFDLDHSGKEEALPGIGSMLADPTLCYEAIGQHYGVTKQRIGQIAARWAWTADYANVNASCVRQRRSCSKSQNPANVRVVIQKLKRAGLKV